MGSSIHGRKQHRRVLVNPEKELSLSPLERAGWCGETSLCWRGVLWQDAVKGLKLPMRGPLSPAVRVCVHVENVSQENLPKELEIKFSAWRKGWEDQKMAESWRMMGV